MRVRDPRALLSQRFVLRIDRWERTSTLPDGHLVRLLGRIGDLAAERRAVLARHGVTIAPFGRAALEELPRPPQEGGGGGTGGSAASGGGSGACRGGGRGGWGWVVAPEELTARRDMRDGPLHTPSSPSSPGGGAFPRCTMSIDPPGCTDVDDALSVARLPGGGFELAVHIADVAAYVAAGGALDAEARERGTTVYLVDERVDMLPDVLSANLCSLLAERERLAVSQRARRGGGGGARCRPL